MGELIFVRSADRQIYRINVDGTGLTKLTSEGSHSDAAWSPDGKRIAFIRSAIGSQTSDVYLMNADGSNIVRRTTGGQYYSVTWSPDGRILTMSADSNGLPTVLITNAGSPSWSPDGKEIAYAHGTAYYDASQIHVSNADGTSARRATPDSTGWNWHAAWSPDGKKISFTRCVSTCSIYAMELSSLVLTLVSGAGSQEAEWSPDGKWLVLTVYGGGTGSIDYVPSTGGTPRVIFSGGFRPSWRPPTR
jgi:Tol biopolymer transport system component